MKVLRSARDLRRQAPSTPPGGFRQVETQERMATLSEMMSAQTQAAYAAAAAAVGLADRIGDRRTVTVAGMRQVADWLDKQGENGCMFSSAPACQQQNCVLRSAWRG